MKPDLTNLLPCDGEVYLVSNFLEENQAEAYYQKLLSEINWQQFNVKIFGKTIPQPRLTDWYGEKAYSYSGLNLEPKPFSPTLEKLRQILSDFCQADFNNVLCNLYRNGKDSMGWHSDDEKELGNQPIIASISLGQPRWFCLQHKVSKSLGVKVNLNSGSLLLMQGNTQHCWKHAIPKTTKPIGNRINLTFRKIY